MTKKSIFKAARVSNPDVSGWLKNHAVIVHDGLIKAVEPTENINAAEDSHEVYDLGNVSLLPGLVDAHCHMHCSATWDDSSCCSMVLIHSTSPWGTKSWLCFMNARRPCGFLLNLSANATPIRGSLLMMYCIVKWNLLQGMHRTRPL